MIINPILPLWIIIPLVIGMLILIFFTSRGIKLFLRIAIVLVLLLVNFRFMVPSDDVLVFNNNLDVIFVVDTTLSMDALDYSGGPRIEAVKNDLTYIVDRLEGANFSLITHDTISTILLPLTKDGNAVKVAINTMSTPDSIYAKGSDITLFKEELENMLDRSIKKENRKRIVFIVGDGEITSKNGGLISLNLLSSKIDNGAVLGYGTDEGGKIKVETYLGSGQYEYLQDKTSYPYKDSVSRIDEENLKAIAKDLNIDYIHMVKQHNINDKINDINKIKTYSDQSSEYAYTDIYYYFSFLLIPMLLFETILDRRSYR
jgi:Ca-activated chloride channel family protein